MFIYVTKTSILKSSQYFKDIEICTITEKGEEYIGTKSITKSGKKCQMWKDDKNNLNKNYCRNPDARPTGPWCFYGSNNENSESCDIALCNQDESCRDTISGKEYDGPINSTIYGKTCQNWSKQSPHTHHFKEQDFPEKNFSNIGNKCRNPGKKITPWCYTTDKNKEWEYCNIPICNLYPSQTEYFKGKDNLRIIENFVYEKRMGDLLFNMSVVVSIRKKDWTEEIRTKISVWGTEYSSICQKNLNYYQYCKVTDMIKNEEVTLTFFCKKPLLSVVIISPLDKSKLIMKFINGPKYEVKNELNQAIKDYFKEVSRGSKNVLYTASVHENAGPFYLLSDNVIPYAVTIYDKVVMTISNIGKGRIGFMGGEYFIAKHFHSKLEDFFVRVYGKSQAKPNYLNVSYMPTLELQWKAKKILNTSIIWNAHNTLGRDNINLLIKMVQDGLNIIIGIKPWAYYHYNSKFKDSELRQLFLLAGVWPSTELVFGNLRIIQEVDLKQLPLMHLLEYAKSNLSSAVKVFNFIRESLNHIDYYELSEYPAIVSVMSKIKNKIKEFYQTYESIVKSYTPCINYPSNTKDKRDILNMFNTILSEPFDNTFEAPGINFYPGTINLKKIFFEKVEVKLNLKFNYENNFIGVMAPSSKVVTVFIQSQKSTTCRVFVNYHLFDITRFDSWNKWPRASRSYLIKTNTTRTFINSFGGLLSISCDKNDDKIKLKLSNVVIVPFYDLRNKLLGKMWNELKDRNVPWVILAADSIIFIAPIILIRNIINPQHKLELWDKMIKEELHLRGRSVAETRRELVSSDFQTKGGYMHSGYPIGTFIQYITNPQKRDTYLFDEEIIRKSGSWGLFHEVGHNLQNHFFTFSGTGDVTNNIFSLVATETITGSSSWNETSGWIPYREVLPKIIKHIKNGKFSLWQSSPFIALGTYAQLRAAFGWEFYRQIFRRYDKIIIEHQKGKISISDEEKIQLWIIESSKLVKMNLIPFYDLWAWPISEKTEKLLDNLPLFLPDDFLTKLTSEKVNEIIAKYKGKKVILRQPLNLPIVVGPLKDSSLIEGYPCVEQITVV